MRRTIAYIVSATILALCATNPPAGDRIAEDDPQWQCEIHGNRSCE